MPLPAILLGAARFAGGAARFGYKAISFGNKVSAALESTGSVTRVFGKVQEGVKLDVKFSLNKQFEPALEKAVIRSMGRAGQQWAKGMRADMKSSTPRKKRGKRRGASQPFTAPAIQTRTLHNSVGYVQDKPIKDGTQFKMYVGSVKNQKLKPVSLGTKGIALPHQYGYWLEHGNRKFKVHFKPRPWFGPGSTTHKLWVHNRYFVEDFSELLGQRLGTYIER
mgnify:CR=1 FL=1|jgi:hypothetical protein